MPRKNETQIRLAREASMEKRGENPANFSPKAAKMERSMSQDELRKKATKPSSSSTRRASKPKK
jgi:hypothetical protein